MIALLTSLAQGGDLIAPAPTPGPTPISADPTVVTPTVEWSALLPLLILAGGAVILLTVTSLLKDKLFRGFASLATIVVAAAAMLAVLPVWARVQGWPQLGWIDLDHPDGVGPFSTVAGAVGIDGFSLFVTMTICAAVVVASLFAAGYLRREGIDEAAFSVLVLLSAAGGVVMAMANDLIVLFLGLETLSLAVYVLTAMHLRRSQSQEGGLKYFILGAFSSAFLLYGIALIYGATGSTSLLSIKNFLAANLVVRDGLLLLGLALLLVGLGFKIAAMPFHAWSPDAYDGAPTPAVAYMAAAVKAAAFAGIVRVFMVAFETQTADWRPLVYALAVLSMVGGALLAIVQSNVKRMLAYSSISHAGFILVAVAASNPAGVSAVLFYLAAYTFMVAGSFGVVTLVARAGDDRHDITDFRGLARTNPGLSLTFTVFLLAQAGIPFTSGFFAKFTALAAAVQARIYWLPVVAMVSAVIAAFLYLRLVVAMYMGGGEHGEEAPPAGGKVQVSRPAALGLALCLAFTIGVGIFPATVLDAADQAVPVLVEPPPAGLGLPPSADPFAGPSGP